MAQKTPYHDFNMTHEKIGEYFGISRAAAGQLEVEALKNFRKELEKRGIKMEDLLGGMR
jgi:DNA-directed RNA polymerase specialized sigma subunit